MTATDEMTPKTEESTMTDKASETTVKQRRSRSKSLPRGKYTLVGVDIDTTGRRLIDEIVHLSAYTPTNQFSQYIMPYMNLNPAARQRHQLRVITVGFFRMLKSMHTYKPIKTKSEIATLLEFLDWLEKLRKSDPDSQGIILIYHEKRKFLPYMLLEAFKKYELLSRFLSSIRSFVNGYDFASAKCANTVKYLNLRQLSRILLNSNEDENDRNNFEGNAAVRSRLAYDITAHLAKGEQKDLAIDKEMMDMVNVIYEFTHPVSYEIAELRNQKLILEKQNSLRPIFIQYFKATLYNRVKGVTFRRILAEAGYEYESLQKLWQEKSRDGIAELIEKIECDMKSDEKVELIELVDSHMDPQKTAIKPPQRIRPQRHRSRLSSRRNRKNNNQKSKKSSEGHGDKTNDLNKVDCGNDTHVNGSNPDSTTESPQKQRSHPDNTNKTDAVTNLQETNNNSIAIQPYY